VAGGQPSRRRSRLVKAIFVCVVAATGPGGCTNGSRGTTESPSAAESKAPVPPAGGANEAAGRDVTPNPADARRRPTTDSSLPESLRSSGLNTSGSRTVPILTGSSGSVTWRLFAWREGRGGAPVVCQRIAEEGPTTSASTSGCDFKLPIDLTELFTPPDARLVGGPVTITAATVILRAQDGREWRLAPQGKDLGFGQAFFVAVIDQTVLLRDVVAVDPSGHIIGRKPADTSSEARVINRSR
jgi:hypothetical protein